MNYITQISQKLQKKKNEGRQQQQNLRDQFVNISQQHSLKPKMQAQQHLDCKIRGWNQQDSSNKNLIKNNKVRPATSRFTNRIQLKSAPMTTPQFYLQDFLPIQPNNHAIISIDKRAKQRTQFLKKRGSGYLATRNHSTIDNKNTTAVPFTARPGIYFETVSKAASNPNIYQHKQSMKPYCPSVVRQYISPRKTKPHKNSASSRQSHRQHSFHTLDISERVSKRCPMSISPTKSPSKRTHAVFSATDGQHYASKTNIKIIV